MKKMFIASDFDGTINCGDGREKDANAILKWREAGNIFSVISGRNTPSIRQLIKHYELSPDYVMGDSGNTKYTIDGELVDCNPVDAKYVMPLCDTLMEMGTYYICINQPEVATIVYHDKRGKGDNIELDRDKVLSFKSFTQVSAVYASGAEAQAAADCINERFDGNMLAHRNGACLDIVPNGSSKAVCISDFTEKLGISFEDVYCIGDNYNDIPMLDKFNSFVVNNAPDDVKKHAKMAVVDSVADMIEYLLNKV